MRICPPIQPLLSGTSIFVSLTVPGLAEHSFCRGEVDLDTLQKQYGTAPQERSSTIRIMGGQSRIIGRLDQVLPQEFNSEQLYSQRGKSSSTAEVRSTDVLRPFLYRWQAHSRKFYSLELIKHLKWRSPDGNRT
ncbi:Acyl-CoA ligase easD [Fusarium oxysporum f. sp. albedinis]|nr:Acyl-CoA ligase easD [Fusarium oxysporum f. sp. albedinis]